MQSDAGSKPLRVLLFSTLFPHEGEPTLGVFVQNRLEHLIRDTGIEVTVVAPVPWFPFKAKIFGRYGRAACAAKISDEKRYTVYHPRYLVIPKIGMRVTPFFLFWCATNQVKRLSQKGNQFDVIDAHYLYPDGVAAAKLARKNNLPFVMTARGSDVTQIAQISSPKKSILWASSLASHIITVSLSLKQRLVSMGVPESSISSLRNGVDTERFKPVIGAKIKVCSETGLAESKPIVLFAGWLIPRKRVDIVIDALANLTEVQGVIVGDGELKSELTALVRHHGIEDRVVLVGQKKPEEMATYMSAADIFCLPSEREGWANVMLEAMACGTPVVSRAVDGALELITDQRVGRLVEGSDPEDYSYAVSDILATGMDRHFIREYSKNFGWKATSLAQLDIFQTAVANHKEKRRQRSAP